MLLRRLAAWGALVLSTGAAAAQNSGPQLYNVTPPGGRQGTEVEVTVSGTSLDGAESLLFSDARIKAELVGDATAATAPKDKNAPKVKGGKMGAPKATGAVKFKVAVPADVRPGLYDVRVVSKAGLSNPRAFAVGDLAEVEEKEPNNDVPEAQKVELDTTVSGVISTPTDVDYVSFKARAGQKVVVYCLTTSIDSKLPADLLVYAADGKPMASGRGYRGDDAAVDFVAPSDGEYVVRVSSFAYITGGTDHFYRLTVTSRPWIDVAFPPLWPAGGTPVVVHGRNLAGGTPDPKFLRPDGRPLDSISVGPLPPAPGGRERLATDRPVPPANGFVDGADLPLAGPDVSASRPFVLFPQAKVFLDNGDNDTPERAQPITVPCDVAGRVEKRNDRDWYSFDAKMGDAYAIEVFADRIGSQVDAYFLLTDDKGKVIVEADDGADTLSPNQFYTRSDDPGRYRFAAPADGKYRIMVSTREAGIQFGVRDVYVLRIAPERPDFRLAVMPFTPHVPEGAAVNRGGSALLAVFVDRRDGFDGPIALSVSGLPAGVACPDQVVGPQQARATLVLSAAAGAADWAGHAVVKGTATIAGAKVEREARAFSVIWPLLGNNGNAPNSPVLTRMDRGPGLALAVRGEALFSLAPATAGPLKAKAGEKLEVALKVTRKGDSKEAIQVQAGTTFADPRRGGGGGNGPPVLATIDAGKAETKVSLDIPATLPSGTYSVTFRGVIPDPASKQNSPKPPKAAYPSQPILVEVTGKDDGKPPKKKKG